MLQNFLIKLFAEDNQILAVARKTLLIWVPRIPDPCLAHEMEPRLVHNGRYRSTGVSSEEDGSSEDALEGAHQPAILGSALLHAEGVQHFGGAAKGDPARLLVNCSRCAISISSSACLMLSCP